jgi:hypothetical protein
MRYAGLALPLSLCAVMAQADTVNTPTDAFNAGKAFGATGVTAAGTQVNSSAASANIPNYTTSPPEASIYGSGSPGLASAAQGKIVQCQTTTARNEYAQQECDAINFVQQNPTTRPKLTIDPATDSVIQNSKGTIQNPGSVVSGQVCQVQNVTVPATYTTQTCEQSVAIETNACNMVVTPVCGYYGSPLGSSSTNQSGLFPTLTLTKTATVGLYNYAIVLPSCRANADGWAEIGFSLDTIGKGSYITINLSNLDDAAAVGMNGYPVFAGYPNAGPYYSGNSLPNTPSFQIGYSWSEKELGQTRTYTANTKIMDSCPAGYRPMPMGAQTYTPYKVSGFFCNSQGKFLMNRHEGSGAWSGSVSSQMPLQQGMNRLQVYWGTGTWANACGSVSVTGQIYNVAPECTGQVNDGCAAMRAAK